MHKISNRDREEIITLLYALKDRNELIPSDTKSIKESNITRRANVLIRKLKSKK